jgi:hypothetical protein
MAKSTKAKKITVKKTNGATKKSAKKSAAPRTAKSGENKSAAVIAMMQRASGVTRAQVLEVTGWKAVSMQQLAKAAGVKIKLEKVAGKPIVYRGGPDHGKA